MRYSLELKTHGAFYFLFGKCNFPFRTTQQRSIDIEKKNYKVNLKGSTNGTFRLLKQNVSRLGVLSMQLSILNYDSSCAPIKVKRSKSLDSLIKSLILISANLKRDTPP